MAQEFERISSAKHLSERKEKRKKEVFTCETKRLPAC